MGFQDKMGIGKCCCGCTIAEDAFESGDALTVAWTGDTSDFTKSGGVVTTTTASKMIRHSTENTATNYEFTLKAKVKGSNAADKVRLVGSYYDDSNYVFIEIATAATTTMKLYQRKAGTNTQLGSTRTITGKTTGDWITVRLCVYSDTAYAEALTTSGSTVTSGALSTGAPYNRGGFAGFATDSLSGTALFDDFLWQKNRNTDATCPQCDACDSVAFSDAFSVEEFGWSDAYFRFTLSGGEMIATVNTATNENARCMIRPTLAIGTVIEQSVLVYDTDTGGGTTTSIKLNTTLGGSGASTIRWTARWRAGDFQYVIGIGAASTIATAPVDGDKLTIRSTMTQVSPQIWTVEWLLNDVVQATTTGSTLTMASPFYHGVHFTITAAGGKARWDSYEISAT